MSNTSSSSPSDSGHPRRRALAAWVAAALACAAAPLALAEKADRSKPMVIEAQSQARMDYQQQVLVYTGNVVISQGSMLVKAERVEVRETPDGYRSALAVGSAKAPASWSQRRDVLGETVEGTAVQIEFDGRANTVRLRGSSQVRRLRAGQVVDEVDGALIIWDNSREVFTVEGGTASAANPTGRVRTVFTPPAAQDAAASAAASNTGQNRPRPPLTPTRQLGDRR